MSASLPVSVVFIVRTYCCCYLCGIHLWIIIYNHHYYYHQDYSHYHHYHYNPCRYYSHHHTYFHHILSQVPITVSHSLYQFNMLFTYHKTNQPTLQLPYYELNTVCRHIRHTQELKQCMKWDINHTSHELFRHMTFQSSIGLVNAWLSFTLQRALAIVVFHLIIRVMIAAVANVLGNGAVIYYSGMHINYGYLHIDKWLYCIYTSVCMYACLYAWTYVCIYACIYVYA